MPIETDLPTGSKTRRELQSVGSKSPSTALTLQSKPTICGGGACRFPRVCLFRRPMFIGVGEGAAASGVTVVMTAVEIAGENQDKTLVLT